jgi:hypothetical protein
MFLGIDFFYMLKGFLILTPIIIVGFIVFCVIENVFWEPFKKWVKLVVKGRGSNGLKKVGDDWIPNNYEESSRERTNELLRSINIKLTIGIIVFVVIPLITTIILLSLYVFANVIN